MQADDSTPEVVLEAAAEQCAPCVVSTDVDRGVSDRGGATGSYFSSLSVIRVWIRIAGILSVTSM